MTILANTMRRATALATLAAASSAFGAPAQVASTPVYAAPPTAPVVAYAAPPTSGYAQHPMHSGVTTPVATPAYGQPAYGQPAPAYATPTPPATQSVTPVAQPVAQPVAPVAQPVTAAAQPVAQPAYGQPAYQQPAYQQPAYQQPAYTTPRLADASQSAGVVTPITPAMVQTPAVQASHAAAPAPAAGGQCGCDQPSASWESYAGAGCAQPGCGTTACGDGCGAGGCGTDSCYGTSSCGTGVCDLGVGAPRKCRQWFGGLYYLLLDRVETDSQQVAYLTDTSGFTAGDPYYYQPADACLHTGDADFDVLHGAEIRFGSTFGPCDPCACQQRFAWELAYWGIETGEADAWLLLDDAVSSTYFDRIYSTMEKAGLQYDIDGGGGTYSDRPGNEYHDKGVPADGDIFANDVRLLAMRVRRRFTAQNLELNFWRFGMPECASSCGAGACGGASCGSTCGVGGCGDACGSSCGSSCGSACGADTCGVSVCQPSRPPRRFFINGLLGVRYFRVDDDLGIDTQYTLVDGAGDPLAGWGNSYTGFPTDEVGVIIEDYEADNELIGFQLGCSMNWLVGCRWNLFADSNFGLYGNNVEVYKRVFLGGGGSASYIESGDSFTSSRSSDTNLAFLGELRTGVAYQVSCNCRLSAAYRFIGAGGLALSQSQIPQNYANGSVISNVNADDSLILHGLQLGAEYQY